jgi:hypothetical protein
MIVELRFKNTPVQIHGILVLTCLNSLEDARAYKELLELLEKVGRDLFFV